MQLIVICLLGGICYVSGYGTFRSELPNGERVPHPCKPNTFWRGAGHQNAAGGGSRNPFGDDFSNNGQKWTRDLCMKDSDGDGKTNGEELGDPNCVWVKGETAYQEEDITHPGICTPFYDSHCQGRNDWVDCEKKEFVCPALSRPDTQNITMRFTRTHVPPHDTTYKCMIFDVPTDQDYHIVAYKPEIDNDNVMHHIVFYGCEDSQKAVPDEPYDCNMAAGYSCGTMLGGWTLGAAGDCLNENYGLLFGKNKYKRMALELHWNNPKLETNWYDASGMTLFYTSNLRANNGGVLSLGQLFLEIPPGRDSTTFTSTCPAECTKAVLTEPIYVAGALNHMHYLGTAQSVEHRRNGSTLRYITNDDAYSYDNPLYSIFETPFEILPNDELITTCEYNSKYSKKWVYYGDATSDEMCFAFLGFYPAEAVPETYCVSYKSIDVCAVRKKPVLVNGCNAWEFVFFKETADADLYQKVDESCNLNGHCHEACEFAVLEAQQHPCLTDGEISDYVRSILHDSKEGLKFLKKLDMCVTKKDYVLPVGSGSRSGVAMLSIIASVFFCTM